MVAPCHVKMATLEDERGTGRSGGSSAPKISAEPDLSVMSTVVLGGTSRRSSDSAGRV